MNENLEVEETFQNNYLSHVFNALLDDINKKLVSIIKSVFATLQLMTLLQKQNTV